MLFNKKIQNIFVIMAYITSITACGSGGGGGATDNNSSGGHSNQQVSEANNDGGTNALSNNVSTNNTGIAIGDNLEDSVSNDENQASGVSSSELQNNNPVEPSFESDLSLLEETASDSSSLYVDESFRFERIQKVRISMAGSYNDGSPIQNSLIRFSKVDENLLEIDGESIGAAETLLIARLDETGQFDRMVEWPPQVTRVLVELSALGIENEILLDISNNELTHYFK